MAVVNAGAAAPAAWLDVSRSDPSMPAMTMPAEQGRELARLQLHDMIHKIQSRAREHRLDRGLTVSLPYFDEGAGEQRWREIVIIPRGRVPFVPAFVVLAAEREREATLRDRRLGEGARRALLRALDQLATAFRS